MAGASFFSELRQRKVPQAAAIYGAVAWGVTEVVVTVVEQLFLPQWVSTLAVIGFVVGFPVAMFLAWTFDITSEGIRRTSISSRRGQASILLSLLLLVAGTAGLFFLIRPSLQDRQSEGAPVDIMPNSIAVLPFDNAGGDPSDDYLSAGLSDELRDQLGRVAGLRIAARSSSVAALQRGMGATAASASLGVAHLVEGSLRRQGNRLRVSVQLIEGATGLALWSDTFERGARELLGVQQTIAEEIVRRVLPDAKGIANQPATLDAGANELMLLAQHYERQVRDRQVVDTESLLKAVALYRQAAAADPKSALAHSRLAGSLLYLGDIEAAEAPIFKALALNPNLSEVQNTLGEFYWARGTPEARVAFARAVELDPNNADALTNYSNQAILSTRFNTSGIENMAPLYRRALELDPLSLSRHAALGEYLGKFGYADQLPAVIEDIRQLFDGAEAMRLISSLEQLRGNLDRAIAWALRARNLEPEDSDHVERLAELYALIGDFDTVMALQPEPGIGLLFFMRRYEELIDQAELLMIEEPNDVNVRYLLAFAYQAIGKYEAAVHVLSTTGLPDSVLDDRVRSIAEINAYFTLINALAGIGEGESGGLARSLAEWSDSTPWWGALSWQGVFRGCNLAVLQRPEEALEQLARIREAVSLAREPYLRDLWCWRGLQQHPVYQEIVQDQEARRAALRARLPATLAEFGVTL